MRGSVSTAGRHEFKAQSFWGLSSPSKASLHQVTSERLLVVTGWQCGWSQGAEVPVCGRHRSALVQAPEDGQGGQESMLACVPCRCYFLRRDSQHVTAASLKYNYQCSQGTDRRKSRVCRMMTPNQFKCLNFFFFLVLEAEEIRNLMGAWIICTKIVKLQMAQLFMFRLLKTLPAAKGCLLLLDFKDAFIPSCQL